MDIKDYVALFFGLVGTILGLVNLYRDIKKSKVSAVVKPYPAIYVSKGSPRILNLIPSVDELLRVLEAKALPERVVIQVANSGAVPLYIIGVGFFNPKTPLTGRFYLITEKQKGASGIEKLDPNEQKSFDTELSPKLEEHLRSGFATAFVELGGAKIATGSTAVFENFVATLIET